MQNAIIEGKDIELPNLFSIKYSISKIPNTFMVSNEIYTLDDQISDVANELNIQHAIISRVINNYYKRINDLVGEGYRVTVKGIASIEPKRLEDGYYTDVIISPVLSKMKVESKSFNVVSKSGNIGVMDLGKANLRYNVEVSDALKIPTDVIASKRVLAKIDL